MRKTENTNKMTTKEMRQEVLNLLDMKQDELSKLDVATLTRLGGIAEGQITNKRLGQETRDDIEFALELITEQLVSRHKEEKEVEEKALEIMDILEETKQATKKVANKKAPKAPKKDVEEKKDTKKAKAPKEDKKAPKAPKKDIEEVAVTKQEGKQGLGDTLKAGDILRLRMDSSEIINELLVTHVTKTNILAINTEDEQQAYLLKKSHINKGVFNYKGGDNKDYTLIVC